MKISERSQKLASVVEASISTLIHQTLSPDKVGFITVTAVEISGDLQVGDIFIRSLNGPENFMKHLRKNEKKIAHLLTKELNLRHAIILRFKEDKSVKAAEIFNKPLN